MGLHSSKSAISLLQLSMLLCLAFLLLSTLIFRGLEQDRKRAVANVVTVPSPPLAGSGTRPVRKGSSDLDHSVRKVDFLNFTYDWFPKGYGAHKEHSVTLKDGEMEPISVGDPDFPGDKLEVGFAFTTLSYGDLTSDNIEDAVVLLSVDENGSTPPSGVLVYTMEGAKPKLLWSHTDGGGPFHGLRDAYALNGFLIIEEYEPAVGSIGGKPVYFGGSETYTRRYYLWNGSTFKVTNSVTLKNEDGYARLKLGPNHNQPGENPSD